MPSSRPEALAGCAAAIAGPGTELTATQATISRFRIIRVPVAASEMSDSRWSSLSSPSAWNCGGRNVYCALVSVSLVRLKAFQPYRVFVNGLRAGSSVLLARFAFQGCSFSARTSVSINASGAAGALTEATVAAQLKSALGRNAAVQKIGA